MGRRAALLTVVLALYGCSGAAVPTPSAVATSPPPLVDASPAASDSPAPSLTDEPQTPSPLPPSIAPPTAAPSHDPTTTGEPAPTGVPESEFLTADTLVICLPFDRSRFAEFDASGKAVGVDVEIAEQIAAQLGREPALVATLFDDLIGEIEARRCDITVGGQFITHERLERIDMIPYRQGTPHVIVPAGNPLGIDELSDLCGRSFAVVGGTIYVDMVHGQGDYAGAGLDASCVDGGAQPIDLREYDSQAAAEQALADAEVDAYAGNDFVTIDRPDVYERTVALPLVRNGIGHFLGAQTVDADVRSALRAIIDDGTYADILSRYGVPDIALTVWP
ncbi:MAG TPA: transporter substrate-binding domain-containing protein [Candidatus Limnocylindrales bacterium]|nr:transporter substrate-binding domain-containing protein [Candidatus Limnocylindrales bacterium]